MVWGQLTDAGGSRGTFRERWILGWEPEHAVHLVENLAYGATIEAAARARLIEAMRETPDLPELAGLVRDALVAQLPEAASLGIPLLDELAAKSADCGALLSALPSLVDTCRYGTARAISTSHLEALARRMALLAAVNMPYAARGLDAEQSGRLYGQISGAHAAARLAELAHDDQAVWDEALLRIARDGQATPLNAGLALRLPYESGSVVADEVASVISHALWPGVATQGRGWLLRRLLPRGRSALGA